MNLDMKPEAAITHLEKILRRTTDTWEHDALVLAIETLKEKHDSNSSHHN